jgi:hypothetical protein
MLARAFETIGRAVTISESASSFSVRVGKNGDVSTGARRTLILREGFGPSSPADPTGRAFCSGSRCLFDDGFFCSLWSPVSVFL